MAVKSFERIAGPLKTAGTRCLAGAAMLGAAMLALPGAAGAQDAYEWRGPDGGGWRLEFGWDRIDPRPLAPEGRLFEYGARSPGLWGEPALPADIDRFQPLLDMGELIVLRGETVWRPFAPLDWRPFTDGAWDFDAAQGWVWSGADPWSSVTDHTGTWRDDIDMGWVWSPRGPAGWSPARVSWRIGAGLIGWAPLNPEGEADPRHFVFIPLDGLIAPGQTAALGPVESRAVYGRTQALSTDAALRLSPADLAVYGQPRAPRDAVAALPEPARQAPVSQAPVSQAPINQAPIRTAPLEPIAPAAPPRFDTQAPEGRFEAGPDASVEVAPEAPILRTPPPVPAQRPNDIAALPEPSAVNPQPAETPASNPNASVPTINAEAEPEGASEPDPASGPRVVGPRWLSNGDCSARGIREGRCRTD
ncbi:MAG: DUF6600 domain-containing protein [Pseudomonadota bacterium]